MCGNGVRVEAQACRLDNAKQSRLLRAVPLVLDSHSTGTVPMGLGPSRRTKTLHRGIRAFGPGLLAENDHNPIWKGSHQSARDEPHGPPRQRIGHDARVLQTAPILSSPHGIGSHRAGIGPSIGNRPRKEGAQRLGRRADEVGHWTGLGREPSKGLERRRAVTALTSWGMWDFSTWLSCWAMASCGWCGVGAWGLGGRGSAYCRCRALSKWSAEL